MQNYSRGVFITCATNPTNTFMHSFSKRFFFLTPTAIAGLRWLCDPGRDFYPLNTSFFRFVFEHLMKCPRGRVLYFSVKPFFTSSSMTAHAFDVEFFHRDQR